MGTYRWLNARLLLMGTPDFAVARVYSFYHESLQTALSITPDLINFVLINFRGLKTQANYVVLAFI